MISTLFQTFNDTRSAIQQISDIISQNFEPDMPTQVSNNSLAIVNETTAAPSDDQNNVSSNLADTNVTTTTTTQRPFRFTPNGLQELLRRNLRGLVRLFNIEWQEALNVSFYYIIYISKFSCMYSLNCYSTIALQ